jgi:hypothetical protein
MDGKKEERRRLEVIGKTLAIIVVVRLGIHDGR